MKHYTCDMTLYKNKNKSFKPSVLVDELLIDDFNNKIADLYNNNKVVSIRLDYFDRFGDFIESYWIDYRRSNDFYIKKEDVL